MATPRNYYNDPEPKRPSPRRRLRLGGGGPGEEGSVIFGIIMPSTPPTMSSLRVLYLLLLLLLLLPPPASPNESHRGWRRRSQEAVQVDGLTACDGCPNDGSRSCIGRSIDSSHCLPCATGQTWWPCNILDECYCGAVVETPPLSSSSSSSSTSSATSSGQDGSTACDGCPNDGVRDCIATSASIGDAHCALCATGQTWWPCNLVDECHCAGPPTSSPTVQTTTAPSVRPTTTPSSSPLTSRSDEGPVPVAAADPPNAPGGGSTIASPPTAIVAANALAGMRVVDAHLTANKVALSRELLLGSTSSHDADLSYAGFRYALRSMIATHSHPPYRGGYGTGAAGLGEHRALYVGDADGNNGRAYGLVNVALFLAMSASDSIRRGGCDEVGVEFVEHNGVVYLPAMNACGQGGMDYTDMGCGADEATYDCPVDEGMRMTAGLVSPGTSFVNASTTPMPLYCRPSDAEGEDEGVGGCCWWGRGSIRLRGTCIYGKLNYFLGKRAHDEGRPSMYPDIDFCSNPQAVCSERSRHPELPWTAGLFRWVTEVQPYKADGFDYLTRLRDFVDGGLRDGSFALAVAGIVATGCHAPPCSKGWGGGVREGAAFDGSDRIATFARTLTLLGLPAEFYASS